MKKKEKLQALYIFSGVIFATNPEIFFSGLKECFQFLSLMWEIFFLIKYWQEIKEIGKKTILHAMGKNISEKKKENGSNFPKEIQKFWKKSENPTREKIEQYLKCSRNEAEKIILKLKEKKAIIKNSKNQYIKNIENIENIFEENFKIHRHAEPSK